MNLDEYDLAIDYLNKVLDYNSENFDTLNEIGLCYYYSENYDMAYHYFNNLLKI